MDSLNDDERTERRFDLNSILHASEPLTTKEFFALDVDEKLKVELIGAGRRDHVAWLEDERPPNQAIALPRRRHSIVAHRTQRKAAPLVEIPLHGEEQVHLGQGNLDVGGFDVPVDLDAIARLTFGE